MNTTSRIANSKTAIMVIPNKPYEQAWVLQWEDNAETAKCKAWQMARKRKPEDPERYRVNGITY